MRPKARLLKRLPIAAALLIFLVVGVALAALSTVTLDGYIFDLVSVDKSGDQSTWVYAVTVNSDSLPAQGLSHWTLAIDTSCYTIVFPTDKSSYTTPTDSEFGCGITYTCGTGIYDLVEHGADDTLGLSGIKFADPSVGQLDKENVVTHIFTFTLIKTGTYYSSTTGVGVKAGTLTETGTISGPTCGPTVVELSSYSACSHPDDGADQMGLLLALLGLMSAVIPGGALVLRQRASSKR